MHYTGVNILHTEGVGLVQRVAGRFSQFKGAVHVASCCVGARIKTVPRIAASFAAGGFI